MGFFTSNLLSLFSLPNLFPELEPPVAVCNAATVAEPEPEVGPEAPDTHLSILISPADPSQSLKRSAQLFSALGPQSKDAIPLQTPPVCQYPRLDVSGGPISFGNVPINTISPARTVTITNNTNCAINVSMSGPSTPFSATSPNSTLQPGSSTTISVTFRPTEARDFSGYLSLIPNGSVSLSGRGVCNR